ncbi:MAG TPA: hypothetical protein VF789_10445 [Thermoanaerobaculia bacterium]
MGFAKLSCRMAVAFLVMVASGAAAQQDPIVSTTLADGADAQAAAMSVQEYWTPERMASAQPMPIPAVVTTESASQMAAPVIIGEPVLIGGHPPGGGPFTPKVRTFKRSEPQASATPQALGTAPTNPLTGPYGPFQRWTMEGNYLSGWRGVHGKLFFTLGTGNFECSATVIGRSTIATAGHCVSDGAGTFISNALFCPSYYNGPGGVHPSRGCWAAVLANTTSAWHLGGDPDYDYACIVTATTGSLIANKIGNITGWAGRAFNWSSEQPVITFGYPAESPFPGNVIEQTASTEWYNWNPVAGGQVSKVIGSDLNGGASGGGWFLGWRAPGAEFPDTDGNTVTDPAGVGGPFLNGVNSHKRCLVNCSSPPTAGAGVFWQEMSSPPFLSTPAVDGDSEEIFATCLAHANNS